MSSDPSSPGNFRMEGFERLPGSYRTAYDDVMLNMCGNMSGNVNVSPSEPMVGLRLGSGAKPDYGDHGFFTRNNSSNHGKSSISSNPTKRSRASYQNMQNPTCQVEGCNLDLKSAKDYHRRHRICESHSKSPKVIVDGLERRFCQQCSRFHDLSEFDDKKRSCRRRLSDHNARRRRVQPDSMHLTAAGHSSALYDHRASNLMLNGLPMSLPNSTWENGSSSILRQSAAAATRDSFFRPSMCFFSDDIRNLHTNSERFSSIQTSNSRALDPCLHAPTSNTPIAPNLLVSDHSLLSPNSWSFNDGEPAGNSMEGLVPGNYVSASGSESQQLSLFQPNNSIINPEEEQGHHVPLLHEYQLFKAPYHSGGFYYTDQRNL